MLVSLFSLATEKTQPYEEKYFTQILDHFNYNPVSYQTFQQRYLINDTNWGGPKSPIFVYTGNEGNVEWFAQNTGFMFENAPRFKALLIFIEHRFYGKSIPYGGNKTTAYSNSTTLGYLSSTQALADYATLILDLKKNLTATDSPVVVFGGSYGGMLAAWFRLKYPHVAIGALASSAPILYFDNITSPYSFNNIITQDFRGESENCYKVIKGSWLEIEHTAKHELGLEILRKAFRICKNFITANDLESWLYKAYTYTAMSDYPTPANFLNPLPAYPIKQLLAAWLRLKYPHIAIGALASSAPILNFDNITSPYSFTNIITQDFRGESENCYKVIKGSWLEIEHTAKHELGLEILRKAFRICKNFIRADYLENWLYTVYTYAAMSDYPTPSNFLNPLPAYPIKQGSILSETDDC
ncbi:hypothetical protein CASFOL_027249 [Castilleja foliolosa]|uniref:Lysosomal Pro-X carboxypeptidase n=1 Tax=Castilleja foliolosa TaxID=1961234 RepID=A0ABD3CF34_9LAMI